jgi:protoporphyrinogen oxidase
MKEKIVILGAGPAGITAAWRLSELGFPVTLLEREGSVGGMGKTLKIGQHRVDYGPHTFHMRETKESKEIIEAIRPFFGKNPLILSRGTRVLLRGKYYTYPLELLQVLTGINPLLSARIVYDYVKASVKSALAPPKREDSFEEWGVRNLGRTLYDLCFGIYSARVWGLPTSQISSKQAQRVAKLNLKNIILRTLGIRADPVTYFTKYMYPQDGISTLYEGMAERVLELGNQVLLHSRAIRLERSDGRIVRVVYKRDGAEMAVECAGVLSTVPLPHLARIITPPLPERILTHAARLRYRSLKLVYIVVDRERLTDFHWVYLLDEHFRCNRISEQKNVSPAMIPSNQTVLCIEISCFKGDEIWNASDEEVFRIAFEDLSKTGFGVKESEVSQCFVCRIDTAYPVYELNFEEHLVQALEGFHSIPNLLTLGRHGLFLNNSMDDNVLLGIKVADYVARQGVQSQSWLAQMLEFMNLRFRGK